MVSANPYSLLYIPDITEIKTDDVFRFNIAKYSEYCTQMGISCITPDRFAGYGPDTLYIPDDHHLSALGAKLVANHVSELLTQKK